MDENEKLDLIAAILAAGAVTMPDIKKSGIKEKKDSDIMLAFRSIRKQLITEGLDAPAAPQKAQPKVSSGKKAEPDDASGLSHMSDRGNEKGRGQKYQWRYFCSAVHPRAGGPRRKMGEPQPAPSSP